MGIEAQSKANATTGSLFFSEVSTGAGGGGEPLTLADPSGRGRVPLRTGILGYRCEKCVSKMASASILEEYDDFKWSVKGGSGPHILPLADTNGLANCAMLFGNSQFLLVVGETRFVNENRYTFSCLNEVVGRHSVTRKPVTMLTRGET